MQTSLKTRLVTASLMWIAGGVVLAGFILSAAFKEHLVRRMNAELAVDLDELRRLTTRTPDGAVVVQRALSDPRYEASGSGHYWEIVRGGRVVARSRSLGAADLAPESDVPPTGTRHGHMALGPTGRVLLVERADGEGPERLHFLVGTDRRHLKSAMGQFNATLAWSMGGFAASMIVAAVLLLLYAMRPLTQVQTALTDVRTGRAKRLDGTFPSEVLPLVDDLNGMMDAMGQTTQKARAQAGNLAHSLKTPLAILTDEAYAVEKAGLTNSATVMFEQCLRMQRHIDYQLARTRSAALRIVPGTSARVSDVIASLASALVRLQRGGGVVAIERRVPDDLLVACDVQDLNEIVANVLDNALKHARSRVVVTASAQGGGLAEIVIEDDGPGLPPEAWEVVFNIGERWDSRAKGTGLGLPIVRDLVQLYGGRVSLGSSPLGGLRVSISLPAMPPR